MLALAVLEVGFEEHEGDGGDVAVGLGRVAEAREEGHGGRGVGVGGEGFDEWGEWEGLERGVGEEGGGGEAEGDGEVVVVAEAGDEVVKLGEVFLC